MTTDTDTPRTGPGPADIAAMQLFHRHDDGYIPIEHRQADGQWRQWGAVRGGKALAEYLPGMLEFIVQDSFFGINALARPRYMRPRSARRPVVVTETGLVQYNRNGRNLRYLTSAYADLDVGRDGTKTAAQALLDVQWLEAYERIPKASIIAESGRGVYLFWLIAGSDGKAQLATPESIGQWSRVNKGLTTILGHRDLEPDIGVASDVVRVLRIPGTLHTATGRKVTYTVRFDQDFQPIIYTLPELTNAIRDELPDIDEVRNIDYSIPHGLPRGASSESGNTSYSHYANARRLHELLLLERHRQGFRLHTRRKAMAHVARFMFNAGATEAQVTGALLDIARNCIPVYPPRGDSHSPSIDTLVRKAATGNDGMKGKKLRNDYIVANLEVTREEAIAQDLRSLIPPELRRQERAYRKARGTQSERKVARRAALVKIIRADGKIPPGHVLLARLRELGHEVRSERTISGDIMDLQAEGTIHRPASRVGRPRKRRK